MLRVVTASSLPVASRAEVEVIGVASTAVVEEATLELRLTSGAPSAFLHLTRAESSVALFGEPQDVGCGPEVVLLQSMLGRDRAAHTAEVATMAQIKVVFVAMAAMIEAALFDRRFAIAARNRCEEWSATICYCSRVRRTVKGA